MVNIFDTLPAKFFNIFNTSDRIVISECIDVLYEYIKDDASFASLKENLIYELTKYFTNHLIELEDVQIQSPRERAFYVYRRLKECGWISEEVGENYQVYTSFEDYAISIIETLMNLDEDRDIEYSSMVYSIYSQFKNFDVENGHKIIDAQYSMTKSLMTKLKNLNTNIKRYIKRLVKDNMKNDLNQILDSLLSDYQMKIVDRAFYNLTTKDHPLKYRNSIISQIQKIVDDPQTTEIIIGNIMLSKDISYQEASNLFYKQTSYIVDAFESILDLINEINRKNEKFVASATNRIMFLMNAKEDIGGKINDILKEGQHYIEAFENVTTLSVNKYLDQNSLYLPRTIKKVKNVDLIIDEPLDENARLEAIEKLKRNEKYTKTAIEKVVLEELSEKESLLGSTYFENQKDLSMFILTWLYGFSQNACYQIEPQNQIIILDLINEINRKNEKFVASATNRIMFLMNAKEDIGGKINDILKEGQHYIEAFENVTTLSVNKYLDQNSLYLPRTIKKVKNVDLIIDEPLDENARLEAIEKLKRNEKYTKTAIEKVVLEELSEKESLLGSTYFENQKDLSMFILTWLYGFSQNACYQIEPQNQIITKEHYQFREFMIRRIEDE